MRERGALNTNLLEPHTMVPVSGNDDDRRQEEARPQHRNGSTIFPFAFHRSPRGPVCHQVSMCNRLLGMVMDR